MREIISATKSNFSVMKVITKGSIDEFSFELGIRMDENKDFVSN